MAAVLGRGIKTHNISPIVATEQVNGLEVKGQVNGLEVDALQHGKSSMPFLPCRPENGRLF